MSINVTEETIMVRRSRRGLPQVFTMSDGSVFKAVVREIDNDGMILLDDGVIINRAQIVTVLG